MEMGALSDNIVADSEANCHTVLRFSLPGSPTATLYVVTLRLEYHLEHQPIAPVQGITAHLT